MDLVWVAAEFGDQFEEPRIIGIYRSRDDALCLLRARGLWPKGTEADEFGDVTGAHGYRTCRLRSYRLDEPVEG